MDRFFEKPTTFLRLLHYPTQPEELGLFGSAPHTDYGYITLLAQDEIGGLEVRNKADEWIRRPADPRHFCHECRRHSRPLDELSFRLDAAPRDQPLRTRALLPSRSFSIRAWTK